MRIWRANIVCLLDTQTAWDIPSVRNVVKKEVKRLGQYRGFVESSSTVETASAVKPGGSAMFWGASWECNII